MEVFTAVMQIFLCLLFILAFGLLMILKPELLWKLKHSLSVRGGEPTEWYLTWTRIGGVVLVIFAVLMGALTLSELL